MTPMDETERVASYEEIELGQLATGLAAHLSRARRRGVKRLPARPAPAVSAGPRAVVATPQAPRHAAPEGPDERIRRLASAAGDLESLATLVAGCEACSLCQTRSQTVFGEGHPKARVMFVGEAPGFHEDRLGRPFVGDAGGMLDRIITKGMGLARGDLYIANILKCRPPENRDPSALEKTLCTGWLQRQIELVNPEVLIPLGRHAAGHLLQRDDSMGKMRARVHHLAGRKIVPTYHPAYLLRTPSAKKDCWKDIQRAMAEVDG